MVFLQDIPRLKVLVLETMNSYPIVSKIAYYRKFSRSFQCAFKLCQNLQYIDIQYDSMRSAYERLVRQTMHAADDLGWKKLMLIPGEVVREWRYNMDNRR